MVGLYQYKHKNLPQLHTLILQRYLIMVSHSKLNCCLKQYGIDEYLLAWIKQLSVWLYPSYQCRKTSVLYNHEPL